MPHNNNVPGLIPAVDLFCMSYPLSPLVSCLQIFYRLSNKGKNGPPKNLHNKDFKGVFSIFNKYLAFSFCLAAY